VYLLFFDFIALQNAGVISAASCIIRHLTGSTLEEYQNLCMNSWFPYRIFKQGPSEYLAEIAYKSLHDYFRFNILVI